MYAIELPVEIDANQQIHVQLPKNIQANRARIIVMYEDFNPLPAPSITLGLFAGKITMSDDFNQPLPDEFWLGDTQK